MSEEPGPSLQQRYAPTNRCFGCGPANERGLRIASYPAEELDPAADPDEVVCTWHPADHHQAFPGVLNGGIVGALLDCHSNWTAIWYLIRRDGLDRPPPTVTADFHVQLRRPTPLDQALTLRARAVAAEGSRVTVEATVEAGGKVTATCKGNFIAVEPGHPAYFRW